MRPHRIVAFFLLLACSAAYADKHRDPLTNAEVDQVRELADQPEKRILLYVQFAKARMLAIEQLRADNKLKTDRGKQIHDLLEDFTTIAEHFSGSIPI